MLAGAAALFGYGYIVNAPPWDFGRLLGVYIVLFFVTAQTIAWVAFGQRPSGAFWLGGAFIVTGGLIIASQTWAIMRSFILLCGLVTLAGNVPIDSASLALRIR